MLLFCVLFFENKLNNVKLNYLMVILHLYIKQVKTINNYIYQEKQAQI